MSVRRWITSCLVMAAAAWLLATLGPGTAQLRAAAAAPQALVDTSGPDALLVVAATAAGWVFWCWGALGLLLTGLSALPGVAGRSAGLLLRVVLPAGARRAAAVAVGLSLAAAAPAAVGRPSPVTGSAVVPAAADTVVAGTSAADWPIDQPVQHAAGPPEGGTGGPSSGQSPLGPPDWPSLPAGSPGDPSAPHVVLRGDCLWDIAADRLARARPDRPVSDADIATEVHAWWHANAAVIGPDPDVLLPGQVLQPPH